MDIFRISLHAPAYRPFDFSVSPNFLYNTKDLICKGGTFYAYWDGEIWVTDFMELCQKIDSTIINKCEELRKEHPENKYTPKLLNDHTSAMMTSFQKYLSQMPQSEKSFNNQIKFSGDEIKRSDLVTRVLPYRPEPGDTPNFDELFGVLYSSHELNKILWFVGALLSGDMPRIQKFLFLYGGKGTGKGTIIKVIKMIFDGYYGSINLKALTGRSEFSTAEVQELPVLIDEDCDISSIENDTNLLKLTAHEPMLINQKYKKPYGITFNGLLVAASNERFKVKHIDSGITRRAIVAEPTSEKVTLEVYSKLMKGVAFEIPMIAQRSIDQYEEWGPGYFENYVDVATIEATDHIFSFVDEYRAQLGDPCTLTVAANLYKDYLMDIGYNTDGYKRKIKTALMKYYREFNKQRKVDGVNLKNVYSGFKSELFQSIEGVEDSDLETWIKLDSTTDLLQHYIPDAQAQLANNDGFPLKKWENVNTRLRDIDTSKLHYARLELNHIVIDFDLKKDGEKDLATNIEAASEFPPTYCEVSKSGHGLHLHYIWQGDPEKLSSIYSEGIEIKVYKGLSSLRRQFSFSNKFHISTISTGLPLKEESHKMYNDIDSMVWTERKIRTAIERNLRKEIHAATTPSIDFIKKILDDATASGLYFDVSDMQQDVLVFAMNSTNQRQRCVDTVSKMIFKHIPEIPQNQNNQVIPKEELWIWDVEVYQNLFIVVAKKYGTNEYIRLANPSQYEIESLLQKPLAGFNNLRYDNHIMYGALVGETNQQLYNRSQSIISKNGNGYNYLAYDLSYIDVYEMSNTKKKLKLWEVELNIKHEEMDWPWDQPLPEELWDKAIGYCENDVNATEAVFKHLEADYNARCILATLSGLPINSTTQQHTAQIIFEGDLNPTDSLVYTDLSKEFPGYEYHWEKKEVKKKDGTIAETKKLVSTYMGEVTSEGGYVHSEPGIYKDVVLIDVASEHPHSAVALNYFGKYTKNYLGLIDLRIAIKHGDYDYASKAFGGKLKPYLKDRSKKMQKDLAYAIKIPINIVYGMTSASFANPFRHPDNIDNIVAKRGALFMITAMKAVQERGYKVCHVKTDSLKIPGADQETIDFCMDLARKYGYEFEHEHTYKRMCLINKSEYIAQLEDGSWEPTGARFAEPYVLKKLFTKEPLVEEDYFQIKGVQTAIYLGEDFVGTVAKVYASRTGSDLLRKTDDNGGRAFVNGTKNHKWRLASDFQGIKDVDMDYYDKLALDAIKEIDKVGPVFEIIDEIPKEYESETFPF